MLWISVAWFGMLVFFLLAVPIYQAPDEHTHVDRILATSVAGFPEYDELGYSSEMVASMRIVGLSAHPDPVAAADAPVRPVPTFAELGSGARDVAAVNQLAGHPPAYYALAAGFRTLVTGMFPRSVWQFDRDVLLLRLFSVLMIMWLPWILARTAGVLGMARWQTWMAAAVPLCLPQLAHIGSAVNNDNLLILACALATMFSARVLRVGLLWGPTLGMAVATAVAIQTKIFGWALVPMVVVVALLGLRGAARRWPRVLTAAVIVALSGWTYLRNLVLYGHPYPTRAPVGQPVAPEDFVFALPRFVEHLAVNTAQSLVGMFGTLWLALPRVWTVVVALLILGALLAAVVKPARSGVRLLLLPVLVIAALYVTTALIGHLQTGAYPAEQGRYLFPVIASAGVAVASTARWVGRWIAGGVLVAIAAVGWVLSARTVLTGFWAGAGVRGHLESLAAWSPIGSASLVLLLAAAVAFWAGLAMASWWGSRAIRA